MVVHWNIWFLGEMRVWWVLKKPIYRRGFPEKGRLAQFADLSEDLTKMGMFLRGSWYTNADYVSKKDVKSFSSQYVWVSGNIQNTCVWCIIIWRNAKKKQFWDVKIVFIMNVFCNILNVVQECSPFMKKNWDNEVGNVVAWMSSRNCKVDWKYPENTEAINTQR